MTSCREREYGGWTNCLALEHGRFALIVTTDVGPRILRCAPGADGPNLFKEFPEELGVQAADHYLLFGGHRLWHSPEAFPRSYALDHDPVEHVWDGTRLVLTQATEAATGIRKSMEIECLPEGHLRVRHRLTNEGLWPVTLAAWAMTLMAAGSRAIVPQEPFKPHPEHLDPARSLTLWHYTRMDDPRVRWGRQFIQLGERGDIDAKFKLGIMNRRRWVACWGQDHLFVKTFGFRADAQYPDHGSNCEIFTMPGFLELESLGPLTQLAPGASCMHDEIWHLWPLPGLPVDDDPALATTLEPLIAQLLFPDT
ncbi:MAG: hypothetical protein JJU27_12115 [Gammaproteobacteria bacterium]|nr:hypothetical protein [Gammaproteobacteria bacterium]